MEPVYLRALELDDLERTHRWHNDQQMYRVMGGTFHYVSRATEESWLSEKLLHSSREVNLAICVTETAQHIGNIYLRNIDWIARHAEVQIWIGEVPERAKGYGYAANRLLRKHASEDLGLQRLYVFILEGNISQKLAEKCGFIMEGKLRKHMFVNGELRDLLVMGQSIGDTVRMQPSGQEGDTHGTRES